MKTEYEVGKWYYGEVFHEVYGVFRHSYNSKYSPHYSESYLENGNTLGAHFMASYDSIATPTQIEKCLKAYAEKNGYVEGTKVLSLTCIVGLKEEILPNMTGYHYFPENDQLIICGTTIYLKGKWAEIVAHAPSVQNTQDEALTERIHEYLTDQDIKRKSVLINGSPVTVEQLCETYYKFLDIKTIIG